MRASLLAGGVESTKYREKLTKRYGVPRERQTMRREDWRKVVFRSGGQEKKTRTPKTLYIDSFDFFKFFFEASFIYPGEGRARYTLNGPTE
jgi:hypothetical protein